MVKTHFKAMFVLGALILLGGAGCSAFQIPGTSKPATEQGDSETALEEKKDVMEEDGLAENLMASNENAVTVSDQALKGSSVTVSKVKVATNGWVAIQQSINGQYGLVVGATAVKAGEHSNVVVPVKKSNVTAQLFVTLREDKGNLGAFDFGGVDPIIVDSGEQVRKTFNVLEFSPTSANTTKSKTTTANSSNSTPKTTTKSEPTIMDKEPSEEIEAYEKSISEIEEAAFTLTRWQITPSTFKVRRNSKVKLTVISGDEQSYTFALPAYGIQLSVNPGESKTTEFTAFLLGNFEYNCTLSCENHPEMRGVFTVE